MRPTCGDFVRLVDAVVVEQRFEFVGLVFRHDAPPALQPLQVDPVGVAAAGPVLPSPLAAFEQPLLLQCVEEPEDRRPARLRLPSAVGDPWLAEPAVVGVVGEREQQQTLVRRADVGLPHEVLDLGAHRVTADGVM